MIRTEHRTITSSPRIMLLTCAIIYFQTSIETDDLENSREGEKEEREESSGVNKLEFARC